jgi:septal ring factor EnvC (AmiA/AmiB activator)
LRLGLRDSEERHLAVLEDTEQENEDSLLQLRMKMERALAEESKTVSEKEASITKLTQAQSALEKRIKELQKDLEASRAESASKDVRISQLQEQMRSGARQMDEQVSFGLSLLQVPSMRLLLIVHPPILHASLGWRSG